MLDPGGFTLGKALAQQALVESGLPQLQLRRAPYSTKVLWRPLKRGVRRWKEAQRQGEDKMNLRISLISFFFFGYIRLFLFQFFLVYQILEFSLNSPLFFGALFWTLSNPCFIPNLRVSVKCAKRNWVPSHETGYQFHIFAGSYSDKPFVGLIRTYD
jgi:hypothetical protein